MPLNHTYLSAIANVFAVIILLAASDNVHAKKSGSILVTIKPLYSLVAHLTDGIESPVLLMKQAQSPHHYNMRPSERRLLAQARLIVWIGPQMESHISKIVQQQNATVVSAMNASDLLLLDARNKHTHGHSSERRHSNTESDSTSDRYDPHIWLSAHNAIAISKHVSQQLIITDPDNSQRYQHNLQQLINKINTLSSRLKAQLQNSNQPFITYHDAFQYFENEHQLRYIDSINFNEETGSSLKHLRKIKKSINEMAITCLLYQPPKPDIVETLVTNTAIKAFALDPLGQTIKDNKNAWFIIMQNMAQNFKSCLRT